MMRLNHNAETFEEICQYFHERSIQMILDGYELLRITEYEEVVVASFTKEKANGDDEIFYSIFVPPSQRGKGHYEKYALEIIPKEQKVDSIKIVTSYDCDIVSFLKKKEIPYTICLGFTDSLEYQIINEYYGQDCAKRSGVPFMNHIDEGLAILHMIGASLEAKKAYCLHPIYQSDETIKEFGTKDMRNKNVFGISANVITNAVEYRWVANNYLSTKINPWWKLWKKNEPIKLSVLKDVNDMLIADKVQNRKDFELYHKGTHKRSRELDIYFKMWLEALGVSEKDYIIYKNILSNTLH
jgi:hypothetical protein